MENKKKMSGGAWLNVKPVCKNDLLIIPRVTNMPNGMYRPEVVWQKGKHSDIVIGETYDNKLRADLLAALVAAGSIMSAASLDAMWREVMRAQGGIRDMLEMIANQIN